MTEYTEEWMSTFTGKHFHFKNPVPSEVYIGDIAHHLSLICRFTGACRVFYSVAEHSVRIANLVPAKLKLAALLHDAPEAYISDISRPVKYSHKLDETERHIAEVIGIKFGIDCNDPAIKEADNILLATEARDLMFSTEGWETLPEPLPEIIVPCDSALAEDTFLLAFLTFGGNNV